MPVPLPVITPVLTFAAAIDELLLLHVPPPASLSDVVRPRHRNVEPVIAPGDRFTVAILLTAQPTPME